MDKNGNSVFKSMTPYDYDRAKMGVYDVVDWLLSEAKSQQCVSAARFYEEVTAKCFPLTPTVAKTITSNLTEIIKEMGAFPTSRGLDLTSLINPDCIQRADR